MLMSSELNSHSPDDSPATFRGSSQGFSDVISNNLYIYTIIQLASHIEHRYSLFIKHMINKSDRSDCLWQWGLCE